jgi:galactose oxidase-like protein/glyoxal oxidase-like protein/PKD domain-containing protein
MAASAAVILSSGGIPSVASLTIFIGFLAISPNAAEAQPQVTGQWVTLSYMMPINPIHLGLLHTGKVLVVAGSEDNATEHKLKISKAAVWDLGGGNIAQGKITRTPDLTWDVFCNGWAFFPDGRCLVIGGTSQYAPFTGEPRTTVFDPLTEKFSEMQNMAHGRWYATGIVMPGGRIMAFSGLNETGAVNNTLEYYTVGSGWSTPLTAPFNPNLYPWLHVLPDGRVFNSGGSPNSNMFNRSTGTWTVNFCRTSTGLNRTFGSSVLLPLLPPNYAARVMILGGGVPNATATTEIIDFSKPTPAWVRMGVMPSGARVDGNSVLLPNGKLLAQGGSRVHNDPTTATLGADLFDPATGTWSSTKPGGAGFATYPRLYHSVALLLPDATVATTGSNPNNTWDGHIEIYSPAYLFNPDGSRATRPVITAAPARIGYNSAPFTVQTPDALNIRSVVLVKPGSDTHAYDMEQRLVGLTFTAVSGVLTVNGPPNSNLAPPGYYMLFVLNHAGVPSVAKFVQVSQNPTDQPPKGTITVPVGDITIHAGQAVKFAGTGSDADGTVQKYSWFFPEGTPESSTVPNPGSIVFPNIGSFVVSLTVVDNKGVNDPSPPTRRVTVQP